MKPSEVLDLTPREFQLLLESETESRLDELEREADKALMMRAAYHVDPKKKLKRSDLFNRKAVTAPKEDAIEAVKQQQEWLNQFNFS